MTNHTVTYSASVRTGIEAQVTRFISPAGDARAGGDWCEVFAIAGDVIALTIGDVAGHGESIAAFMNAMRSATVGALREGRSPSAVLSIANALACERFAALVTAIVAILDYRMRTLTFANAGHLPPLVVTSERETFLSHPPGDLALGICRNHRVAERVVALPAAALIPLYTDGHHRTQPRCGARRSGTCCVLPIDIRRPEPHAASALAERVFGTRRGDDHAAVALRLSPQTCATERNSV